MDYKLTKWQKIYYPTYRLVNKFNPKDRTRDVKHLVQRAKRGWADSDMWSADYYLASIIPPMLRKLAVGNSYPGLPPYDTAKKWAKACNQAADDIEAFYEQDKKDFPKTKKAQDKYFNDMKIAQERTLRGMKFVSDNFFDLWD